MGAIPCKLLSIIFSFIHIIVNVMGFGRNMLQPISMARRCIRTTDRIHSLPVAERQ